MKPHDVPFKQNFTYCWIKFEIESLDNSILKVQDLQVLFHFDHLRTIHVQQRISQKSIFSLLLEKFNKISTSSSDP